MNPRTEQAIREVMSGARRGAAPAALRAALAAAEPFYAGAMTLRNLLYDRGILHTRSLPRPTISVGNLTAGGTGKTPMARWLASRLREFGKTVAILSRGYKSAPGKLGDEQIMLDRLLNAPGMPPVPLRAHPDRYAAALAALRDVPEITTFILDDAFQHRQAGREVDLVLLDANEPFGFGHVLPRGLLRESVRGLGRASAVIITHADEVPARQMASIEQRVHALSAALPIYRCAHALTGVRSAAAEREIRTPVSSARDSRNPAPSEGVSDETTSSLAPAQPLQTLCGRRFLAFCGIGNPAAWERQLNSLGSGYLGCRRFADHHAYSPADLSALRAEAMNLGADALVTTEKDWAKISALPCAHEASPEILRLDVEIQFLQEDADRLLRQIDSCLKR